MKKKVGIPILILGILVAIASLLALNSNSQAQGGYQPGLQHLYPYYTPQSEVILDVEAVKSLVGGSPAEKVRNYAVYPLGLNNLGSVVLGASLYSISELDPLYEEDGMCGLAGWECDSKTWQRLLNFSDSNHLDYQTLEAQLLFINLELNDLNDAILSTGKYQEIYDKLRYVKDFDQGVDLFMSSYLDKDLKESTDLEQLAYQLYSYEEGVDLSPPSIDIPPVGAPPPGVGNLPNFPTLAECQQGRGSNNYIAQLDGGNYLVKLSVPGYARQKPLHILGFIVAFIIP